MNRVQSSRRLERETERNVEPIWHTGRLTPDFKTIADFRKDNGKAIRSVCREFIVMCRDLQLFSEAIVTEARVEHIKQKVETVKKQMRELKQIGKQMTKAPDGRVSLTDPDARSMATSGRGTGMVGYNVQTAVDTKHHVIVAHEVTNVGHDRDQLSPMAHQTCDAIDEKDLTVLADRGYYKGEQIYDCERAGIKTLVPKPQTSGNKAAGLFDKADFRYIPSKDEYRCPAGHRAIWRYTTVEHDLTIHKYWTSACSRCAIKAQCTTNQYRRITRWEHEDVLDAMQKRLIRTPHASRIRRQTVEHPFGTIKAWMGATHFLTKTKPRVSTEMSLHVLTYNLKRAMQILGIAPLIEAMRA